MPNVLRYVMNTLLAAAIVAVTCFVVLEKPKEEAPNFTLEKLETAVREGHLKSISYSAKTGEVMGELKEEFAKQYGGTEFRRPGGLPLALFREIREKKLSAKAFLGPIEGWTENPDYAGALRLKPATSAQLASAASLLQKLPFRPGEEAVYELSALAMTIGELKWSVEGPVLVGDRPAHHLKLAARSSSDFSGIYRLDDWAETFLEMATLRPRGFAFHMNESQQYGVMQGTVSEGSPAKARFWEKILSERQGEITREHELQWPERGQNVVSTVFYVRSLPWSVGAEHAFSVVDRNKEFEVRAKAVREETLSTVAGELKTWVLEPKVFVHGQPKNTPPIAVWLSQDPNRVIAKIEASVKIGEVTARLKSFKPGK